MNADEATLVMGANMLRVAGKVWAATNAGAPEKSL